MESFSSMHEAHGDAQAFHRCHDFLSYEPALADTTYYELSSSLIGAGYGFDASKQSFLRHNVGFVQKRHLRQSAGSSGEDIDGARDKARTFRIGSCERWRKGLRFKFYALAFV